MRDLPWRNSFIGIETDSRKPVALELWSNVGGRGTKGSWFSIDSEISIRPSALVNASVGMHYGGERDPQQWVGSFTALDSTRYVLAEIDQTTLRMTFRVNWTLNRNLSVQLYGQPFVSAASYTRVKEVVAPRASEFDNRFEIYDDELTCGTDGQCEVDVDADGTADFGFERPDFNFSELRSTLVVRWEYRPGSVFFFAWQHGRSAFRSDGSFGGFGDMADLFSEESDNTVLIKANYWLSF